MNNIRRFYGLIYAILWPFFNLVHPNRAIGREHIPEGAALGRPPRGLRGAGPWGLRLPVTGGAAQAPGGPSNGCHNAPSFHKSTGFLFLVFPAKGGPKQRTPAFRKFTCQRPRRGWPRRRPAAPPGRRPGKSSPRSSRTSQSGGGWGSS